MSDIKYLIGSPKRFYLLLDKTGYMDCQAPGSAGCRYAMRYKGFEVIMKINQPLTHERADEVKDWFLKIVLAGQFRSNKKRGLKK